MRGAVLFLILAGAQGCSSASSFACDADASCVLDAVQGWCEPTGFCSFPDAECDSGRRYGQNSSSDLAGECVAFEGTSSGVEPATLTGGVTSDGPGTTGSESTTDTPPETSSSTSASEESSSSTGSEPGPDLNYVFVSSSPVERGPDFVSLADAHCNALADAADLPGSFVAWLPSAEETAVERLSGARGWVRPDGRPFSDRPTDLGQGLIYYPPVIDEEGAELRGVSVLTATESDGAPSGTCEDWISMSSSLSADIGRPGSTFPGWTSAATQDCDWVEAHVYCFGTDFDTVLEVEPSTGRTAFTTAATFDAGQGLDGFDGRCQTEADAAGLDGSFLAVVATPTASALERFDTDAQGWVNVLGIPIAPTAGALVLSSEFEAPANVTLGGTPVGGRLWTGANSLTGQGSSTCGNWTSSLSGDAVSHRTDSTDDWSTDSVNSCGQSFRVLCFEE